MRKFINAAAAASLLMTTGCGAVLKEMRYPGGYPGYILDRHSYNASGSKQLILLRATIVLAMASQMGKETVRGEDADAFAHYVAAAADSINYAAADLYAINGQDPCMSGDNNLVAADQCNGYYSNFESELPQIEQRLIKVMVAALPTDKARKFLDSATKGDVIGAAWNALATFKSLAEGMHFAFGTFRSGTEIVAANACDRGFDEAGDTVREAATCLKLPMDSIFTKTDTELPGDGAVNRSAFHALMRIANTSCTALPFLDLNGTGPAPAAVTVARTDRQNDCARVWFEPRPRPVTPAPAAPAAAGPILPIAPIAPAGG